METNTAPTAALAIAERQAARWQDLAARATDKRTARLLRLQAADWQRTAALLRPGQPQAGTPARQTNANRRLARRLDWLTGQPAVDPG